MLDLICSSIVRLGNVLKVNAVLVLPHPLCLSFSLLLLKKPMPKPRIANYSIWKLRMEGHHALEASLEYVMKLSQETTEVCGLSAGSSELSVVEPWLSSTVVEGRYLQVVRSLSEEWSSDCPGEVRSKEAPPQKRKQMVCAVCFPWPADEVLSRRKP